MVSKPRVRDQAINCVAAASEQCREGDKEATFFFTQQLFLPFFVAA